MDKKIAGLLGAVAAVATIGGAQASSAPLSTDPLAAQSYADLLMPIENASEALVADNARLDAEPADGVQLAQYHHHHHHHHHRYFRHHHHHHHHHRYFRRHHHHHHHHRGAFIGVPGVGGVVVR